MKTVLVLMGLLAGAVHAGSLDNLAAIVGQVAADSNGYATGHLLYSQAARGPYGGEGFACTYAVRGEERTVFKLGYCPYTQVFR